MIVATAGHIDHGKTTLVKALTGTDTDRLPEEKARGISIDLGFAYWQTPPGDVVGFVDVPGHERFIRNMLAGVCGIDYVMLIVAADDGIMPQTVEHLHIVDLLNVSRGIAVITKIDRVSTERVVEVTAAVKSLLASTNLSSIAVLPVAATTGEGVPALREQLALAAKEHARTEQVGRHLRYAIDRAFTMPGSGTVVTGTVFNGTVKVGDKLMLSPAGVEVRVRGLQKQGKSAQEATAGERCALNLSGVELAQVGRGDWVVAPAIHAPTSRLDVRLQVLDSEAQALKHWTPVHFHLGTADIPARVAIRRGASVAPGESAVVQLIAERPFAALHGDRFILRDQSAVRTLGGGRVIDPFAPAARRNVQARAAQLDALENSDPAVALRALLACSPAGIQLKQFERTFNLTPERVEALVRDSGAVVVDKDQRVALPVAMVSDLQQRLLNALTNFHRESPQALGAEAETLRKTLAPGLVAATFAAVVRELVDQKKVESSASLLRLPQHVATANPADEKMWQTVKPVLESAGLNVPPLRELAPAIKIKEPVLKDFLHRKSRTGELIRVTPDRFYPKHTLAQLAAIAQVVAQAAPNGFTAGSYRDRCGLGRSLAIEILECLDRMGITQRIGDLRKMRRDFVPLLGAAEAPPPAAAAKPPQAQANPQAKPQSQRPGSFNYSKR